MEYQLARDGRTFGPYTESEVRERLANGHILVTDIARAGAMDEWLPVATLFPAAPPEPGATLPGGLPRAFPDAPNLHWGLVLALGALTLGGFSIAWSLVQAAWLKRLRPRSTALFLYLALAVLFLLKAPQTWNSILYNTGHGLPTVQPFGWALTLLSAAFFCASHVVMRGELLEHFNRDEPIGLNLSWLLSLLFGDIYFQYHLNRLNAMKRTLRKLP